MILDWLKCKDAERHWKSILPDAVVTVKMDGWRIRYVKEGGRIRIFSRTKEITDVCPHLPFIYDDVPNNSVVEAEMYLVDGRATEIPTALKHEQRERLRFFPIAAPIWDGQNLASQSAAGNLSILADLWREPQDFLRKLTWSSYGTWYDEARLRNIEGWIFKNRAYDGWFKLKVTKTIDCIVTGFKEGKGKNIGEVGSLRVSVWKDNQLVEIATVGGMDDETRWDIDEVKDLMRVVEVEYQNLDKTRLRHPRFVRWRNDKPIHECTWEDQLS